MTREDVIHIFTLRLDGFTLEEIAKQYGVTRQRIHQILEAATKDHKISSGCKCIYPGLRTWFMATGITAYQMNQELFKFNNVSSLYTRLVGKCDFNVDEIKKILKYTGMTFEEAFGDSE